MPHSVFFWQESLTNIACYAKTKQVIIWLLLKKGKLELKIKDDGIEFDIKKMSAKKTLGILGMREHSLMMGGAFSIQSVEVEGTTIIVTVPI